MSESASSANSEKRSVEVERKFSVSPDLVVPRESLRAGVTQTHQLQACYFDTPDFTLLQHKITLRRRSGGDDHGWHVKLPKGSAERTEVHFPLTESLAVPAPVGSVVAKIVGEQPLVPVCVLNTLRHETQLRGRDEAKVLAVLCDDHVDATATDPIDGFVATSAWREWEIELVDGADSSDLDHFAQVVLDAGAEVAGSASKLGAALTPLLEHRREANG